MDKISDAVLQPIVRGQISSVDLTQAGVGYGASEIINFNRQPVITFSNGESAQAEPVINNGKIDSILIKNSGRNYWAPPDVTIESEHRKLCSINCHNRSNHWKYK